MSRSLRIEFAGALYNVTSRQDGQEVIILGEEDRPRFLDALPELVHDFNWAVHAYCLMNNHYHLLIETLEGNLSGDSLKEIARSFQDALLLGASHSETATIDKKQDLKPSFVNLNSSFVKSRFT